MSAVRTALLIMLVAAFTAVGCDSRSPVSVPPNPIYPFDRAFAGLDPDLVRLAEARLAQNWSALKDADSRTLLRNSDAALVDLRSSFHDPAFAPAFRGATIMSENHRDDPRVATACWILAFDARVHRDSDAHRSLEDLAAIIECCHRLVAEHRTVATLIAAGIIDRHSGTLEAAFTTPGAADADITTLRSLINSLDSTQPLAILTALKAEPDILLASIMDSALRGAKGERDSGQMLDPKTLKPPTDTELTQRCSAIVARRRPEVEHFYADLCASWESDDHFLAVLQAADHGDYGTLFTAQSRAMKATRTSLLAVKQRLSALRAAAGMSATPPP